MRAAELKAKVVPGLLAGTSRVPLKLEGAGLEGAGTLAALSLAGQALRFERPAAPELYAVQADVLDARRILPDAIRKPLLWLLRSRRVTEEVELALAWSFARLKLRPHPFDMPRMSGFVKAHAQELGPAAVQWAHRDSSSTAPAQQYLSEAEELNEENWTAAQPAERVRFIVAGRRKDAAGALALVRASWSEEDADMRLRLLETLQQELREGDREFLESLQKDRGSRVRALAERMVYRLNGFSGEHPALREALARIEKKSEGLLRRRTTLKLDVPATVKEHTLKGWVREAFTDVRCDELARGLGLSESDMIEGAAKDANLLLAFALMATTERRLDLLAQVVERLPEAWEQMTQCGPMQLEAMSASERTQWAETLARAYGAQPPFTYLAWTWMHRAVRGPLPQRLLEAVLRSAAWRDRLQEAKGPEWMELLAAVCPAELRERLRPLLGAIEPSQTVVALALLDILNAMEKG
jgi:hypothetical protein